MTLGQHTRREGGGVLTSIRCDF